MALCGEAGERPFHACQTGTVPLIFFTKKKTRLPPRDLIRALLAMNTRVRDTPPRKRDRFGHKRNEI